MEKLERVRRKTWRRMDQVDSELERFEERPELDAIGRYNLLLKRLVELEKPHYKLLRKQALNPYDLIAANFAVQISSCGLLSCTELFI